VFDVREYVDPGGCSPFTKWLRALNVQAAAKVAAALERIADGNLSNAKAVGNGVLEYKIDFGPGNRSISVGTAAGSLSCSPVERRNASNRTSGRPRRIGMTTGQGRLRRTKGWH
jgi:putative component of toxin-antitoxin plasmid stabilization module